MISINKILLLITVFSVDVYSAFSQDIIYKNNGEQVKAKILEITPVEIVYKLYDNPEGPIIRLLKELVFRIQYDNGTSEIIHHDESILSRYASPEALHDKGELDAVMNYKNYKSSGTGTFVAALLGSPLTGLVVAIPATITKPKLKNLNYPDSKLFEKHEYRDGYEKRAYKIKTKRIWINFMVGSAIWSSIVFLAARD